MTHTHTGPHSIVEEYTNPFEPQGKYNKGYYLSRAGYNSVVTSHTFNFVCGGFLIFSIVRIFINGLHFVRKWGTIALKINFLKINVGSAENEIDP